MSRRTRISGALLVLAVVASACGGDTAETTTTAPPATPSSSSTTTVPAEIEIPETGILKFRPGTTYLADGFWEPVSFTTAEDGRWWARGSSELWVHIEYHEEGGSTWNLDFSMIVNDPDKPPDALVSDILADDRLEVTADPITANVTGHGALVLDVLGTEVPEVAGVGGCEFGVGGNSRFQQLFPGFELLASEDLTNAEMGGWIFGVRTCRAARIWVVDVQGTTIVIIAATATQELFDELIPAAQELIAGIEFHP